MMKLLTTFLFGLVLAADQPPNQQAQQKNPEQKVDAKKEAPGQTPPAGNDTVNNEKSGVVDSEKEKERKEEDRKEKERKEKLRLEEESKKTKPPTLAEMMGPYGWILVAGSALLGVIASTWSKVKTIGWRLISLFIQRVEIPTESAHDAIVANLIKRYKRSRTYDRMYGASWEYQRDGRYGLIPYEMFGARTVIFWNGWFPFLFANQMENKAATSKGNNGGDTPSGVQKVYSTITFIRGTLNVEDLLKDSCNARNNLSWSTEDEQEQRKNRFVIHHVPARGDKDDDWSSSSSGLMWYQQGQYRLLAHKPDQLGKAPICSGKAIDNLIFPQRVKDLINEIELWRKSKDWYREKAIPWKRGWMLYGPPGTGKTALARAFAEDLNMPIYVYNLAEMDNHTLMKAWSDMQVNVPCIALIEDIDNVFHGRENVAKKGMFSMMMGGGNNKNDDKDDNKSSNRSFLSPLTYDCLLNCLDGVERSDGIFTVVTTNDISKIDPALGQPRPGRDGTLEFISTRPGRIDKAIELTYMETADKKRMARRILGAYENEVLKMIKFVDEYPDLQETPAQFQERCAQVALRCFWKELQEEEKAKLIAAGNVEPSATGSSTIATMQTKETKADPSMNGKA